VRAVVIDAPMDMIRQVRKALDDIAASYANNQPGRAEMQVFWLRKMIDQQPSRRKPWSHYRPAIDEEYPIATAVFGHVSTHIGVDGCLHGGAADGCAICPEQAELAALAGWEDDTK
jgi:hypothetical protein